MLDGAGEGEAVGCAVMPGSVPGGKGEYSGRAAHAGDCVDTS